VSAAVTPRCARVFLVQDHPLMVLGTQNFLNGQPDMRVSGFAHTPAEVLPKLARCPSDLAVVEVSIVGPFDFTFLRELRGEHTTLPILVYSYHEEVIFAHRALDAGANGYLMKEARPETLAEAVRQVLAGEEYVSQRVRDRIRHESSHPRKHSCTPLNGSLINSLTNRELQIFQYLGDGFPLPRISQQLGLSRKAAGTALYRIRKKLGLDSETELLQFAAHWAYYEGDFS
jgi:DNA-binding NarL/FixJ family response regulator